MSVRHLKTEKHLSIMIILFDSFVTILDIKLLIYLFIIYKFFVASIGMLQQRKRYDG